MSAPRTANGYQQVATALDADDLRAITERAKAMRIPRAAYLRMLIVEGLTVIYRREDNWRVLAETLAEPKP